MPETQARTATTQALATETQVEETFVLIKPDAVRRKLVGEIVGRLEHRDLKMVAARLVRPTRELAGQHYGDEIAQRYGEEIRNALLDYVCGGPCLAMVWRGPEAVATARGAVGLRPQPGDCEPGSVRRDFGCDTIEASRAERRALENLVHTSDAHGSAQQEIRLWGLMDERQLRQ
jgi:nucleoside-diphosphate kinase